MLALHPDNVTGSPGSTWAGAAAILGVLSGALNHGVPVTVPGWIGFAVTVLTGIGAIFSKA